MPSNPPEDTPRLTPYLFYEDVAAALDWLRDAFGFSERMRMPGADGGILHAEMEFRDAVIMLGRPGPDYRNPLHEGSVHLWGSVEHVTFRLVTKSPTQERR